MCFRHHLHLYEYNVVFLLFLSRLTGEQFKYKSNNKHMIVTAALFYVMAWPSTSPHFPTNLLCYDLKAVSTMSDKSSGKKPSQKKT